MFGGAAPRYKWLEDYRRCRGMTGGTRGSLKTWRSLAGSWVKQVCIHLEVDDMYLQVKEAVSHTSGTRAGS